MILDAKIKPKSLSLHLLPEGVEKETFVHIAFLFKQKLKAYNIESEGKKEGAHKKKLQGTIVCVIRNWKIAADNTVLGQRRNLT